MSEKVHPNEVTLTKEVLADLVFKGLTKDQAGALKEQTERQKRVSDAPSS